MIYKYIFPCIHNLECTPSDRQMYPWQEKLHVKKKKSPYKIPGTSLKDRTT